MSSRAVFVCRHGVLFGLAIPAVFVVVRRLPVMMRGRFVVCCGLIVVLYGRMFCSGHGPVPLLSGDFPIDWTRTGVVMARDAGSRPQLSTSVKSFDDRQCPYLSRIQ
ncbi:MAG: hypothetical protein WDN46_16055 [Methylocella sp.]